MKIGEIGNYRGMSKEEGHLIFKMKAFSSEDENFHILRPILERKVKCLNATHAKECLS